MRDIFILYYQNYENYEKDKHVIFLTKILLIILYQQEFQNNYYMP